MTSGNATRTVAPLRAPLVPQRERGRARVAGLMAAASALFVEKGYDATTMTEIASRAGASIGSLYLFFPVKQSLAQAIMADLAARLSERLLALQDRADGWTAAAIADSLFGELAQFLADHPVYAALLDLPGDEEWRRTIRLQRRGQIAALFARATPALPPDQAERLAMIVPQLMRSAMVLSSHSPPLSNGVFQELRAMLRHHLERPTLFV